MNLSRPPRFAVTPILTRNIVKRAKSITALAATALVAGATLAAGATPALASSPLQSLKVKGACDAGYRTTQGMWEVTFNQNRPEFKTGAMVAARYWYRWVNSAGQPTTGYFVMPWSATSWVANKVTYSTDFWGTTTIVTPSLSAWETLRGVSGKLTFGVELAVLNKSTSSWEYVYEPAESYYDTNFGHAYSPYAGSICYSSFS